MDKMSFDKILKESYENLAQRVLASCLFLMSNPNKIKSELASDDSQILLHELFNTILKAIYYDPESLGLQIIPDDSYALIQSQNRKPELSQNLKQIYSQIYELYALLLYCGYYGELSGNQIIINNFTKNIPIRSKNVQYFNYNISFLSGLGIHIDFNKEQDILCISSDKYIATFQSWKLLSLINYSEGKINKQNMFNFMFCVFDQDHNYLLRKIENYFQIEQNYFTLCFQHYMEKDYIYKFECYADPDTIGFNVSCYNEITGFKIQFATNKIKQIFFRLNRIFGAKSAILDFDNLKPDVQNFCKLQLASCCNCGNCIKKGKKESIEVEIDGEIHELCVGSIWMVRDGGIAFINRKHLESIHLFIDTLPQYVKKIKSVKPKN